MAELAAATDLGAEAATEGAQQELGDPTEQLRSEVRTLQLKLDLEQYARSEEEMENARLREGTQSRT